MKKIIASAVVAAATLSASQAAVFNGYSAGITAGSFSSQNRWNHKDNGTTQKEKLNKTFGTYGIHFDYDRSAPNAFYWGLGLDAMLFSGKKTHTDQEEGIKETLKYTWSSELNARLGYNICNNAAVYGLVGVRAYHKKLKALDTDDNSVIYKLEKTRLAPVIGAGIKAKVAANISAGVEYRYAFEKKRTWKYADGSKSELKQDSHAVLAKVSYHF
ncbi:outer membrane protein [Candidatus Odyssella acanthamoebae]|uniref:Outer membrane protein beta-barrel domain-containing protein n=1 Tax=Candidatus Odyssella acanthamoebae TaxID=91604 RepID=A0A077AX09_9PROT|nr:outer membrane beta-barrel protein [Candidatus Paracaedibacter acanthamoebae]AIK97111.1 hypothetical protein ID47_10830 [Candidatus Paracaedibacter acanthamoebae]